MTEKHRQLDYLKIFAPVQAAEVNKADLQTAIESGAGLIEGAYDADKWEAFKEAYKVAVEVMNNADADQDAVEKAAAALNAAMEALGDPKCSGNRRSTRRSSTC